MCKVLVSLKLKLKQIQFGIVEKVNLILKNGKSSGSCSVEVAVWYNY